MDNSEQRLRVVEAYTQSHEGQTVERWKAQWSFNKRLEGDMEEMKTCVQKISTNFKLHTFKFTMLFVVVQIVITAFALAAARTYFGP